MTLTIENDITGPLAHKAHRFTLELIAEHARTIDEAAHTIATAMAGVVTVYKGGSHVAVHGLHNGQMGRERLALIVE